MTRYRFEAERLAYWYLRLNGFLSIENFIVHDEGGGQQRTDADLIAVRFPYRREALHDVGNHPDWMRDDARFSEKRPFVAFVEATTGPCKLNGPWTSRDKANLPRALRAVGAFGTNKKVLQVADQLYQTGGYKSKSWEIGFLCIGSRVNGDLAHNLPNVRQITWNEVSDFIVERIDTFKEVKREHPQWALDGHLLWRIFENSGGDKAAFAASLVLVTETPRYREIEEYFGSREYPGG